MLQTIQKLILKAGLSRFTNPSCYKDVLDEVVRQLQALLVETGEGPPRQNVSASGQVVWVLLVGQEVCRNLVSL